MNKLNLVIEGMKCKSCENAIERRINRLSFVTHSTVDWENGQATVSVTDNNNENRQKLKDTITKLGYSIK